MINSDFRSELEKLQHQFVATEQAWTDARQRLEYQVEFTGFRDLCSELAEALHAWIDAAETGRIKQHLSVYYDSANDLVARARVMLEVVPKP